jgi:transcriptional regulator with XRE-family HTH domain
MVRTKEIPPIITQLGERIAAIIKQKDLKVRNIAHECDMDDSTLRRYIKGTQIMGADKLYQIAKALDVEIGELFKK